MNTQPPEKAVKKIDMWDNNATIDVHSIFATIQGEGPFCGTPCIFIRLAGCNLQCPQCDTDYTQGRYDTSLQKLVNDVIKLHREKMPRSNLIVITGGEPLRQTLLFPLCNMLLHRGFYVQIESNGTLPVPDTAEWMFSQDPFKKDGVYLVCSPKTGNVHPTVQNLVCCYKYVLKAEDVCEDGLPSHALEHTAKPRLFRPVRFNVPVYVQPLDQKDEALNKRNMDACVQSCLEHGYMLQLQVHKIINVE